MPRRISLPGADELFRSTGAGDAVGASQGSDHAGADESGSGNADSASLLTGRRRDAGSAQPTGRERHSEKITVYISGDELIDLERSRLTLRATHGLAIDRGRIVREALAVVLADLAAKGDDSILVRRLRS